MLCVKFNNCFWKDAKTDETTKPKYASPNTVLKTENKVLTAPRIVSVPVSFLCLITSRWTHGRNNKPHVMNVMTDEMNATMWWRITDYTLFNSQRSVLYKSPLVTLASFLSVTWQFSVFQSALFKGPASARDSCRLLIHSSEGSALLFIHTIVILRLPSLWSVNYTSIGIWHLWTCHADRDIKKRVATCAREKKKKTYWRSCFYLELSEGVMGIENISNGRCLVDNINIKPQFAYHFRASSS